MRRGRLTPTIAEKCAYLGSESFTVETGTRIAQMIVAPVVQATFEEVDDLTPTARGAAGFGSTGA